MSTRLGNAKLNACAVGKIHLCVDAASCKTRVRTVDKCVFENPAVASDHANPCRCNSVTLGSAAHKFSQWPSSLTPMVAVFGASMRQEPK
jgi:hypothetical protein